MVYSDTINDLKSVLDSYSDEVEKLSSLYKTAIENAEKTHADSLESINKQFINDRKRVYSDNARDERNAFNLLAERGLGFSGEAAQTKLNSNILLSNRLGALDDSKAKAGIELERELADKKNGIMLEQAQKVGALNDKKNQLHFDIATLEQNIAQKEADRLWEQQQQEAARQWEQQQQEAARQWEQQQQEAALKAEYEMLLAKVQAEKEMQNAELQAKYYAANNGSSGSSSGSGNSGGSGGSGGNGGSDKLEEVLNGFLPDISPKDLAKLMVTNATDDNYIEKEQHQYLINKYLLDIQENHNIDTDYYDELIFMLKAYGYKDVGKDSMRLQVIAHDAKAYYDESYAKYYDTYASAGMSESNARSTARNAAKQNQLAYIRNRTNTLNEFTTCCLQSGLSASDANTYALNYVWPSNNAHTIPGKSGGGTKEYLITTVDSIR